MKTIINNIILKFGLTDKHLHALVSMTIAFIISSLSVILGGSLILASVVSLISVFLIGCAKEYGDSNCKMNVWDWKDIIADMVGGIIGTPIGFLWMLI